MNRRNFILAGLAAGIVGYGLKPSDHGAPYNDYFNQLNQSLRDKGPYVPCMLVDLDIVEQNVDVLLSEINPKTELRIVAKSLPCPELLAVVMARANTNKLMVFHQPFLSEIVEVYPDSDILLGKPMPVKAAKQYYSQQNSNANFNSETQLQWLIDSIERLEQYLLLAIDQGLKLQINIELDVGLHRGGLQSPDHLDPMLALISANPAHLVFSGFMGYDPQIVKLPSLLISPQEAFKASQDIYQSFIDRLYQFNPKYQVDNLCFNGAGSPTIALHKHQTVANELSAGSCLVKPTDFDIPTLTGFKPAAFIATPVLKKMQGTTLPAGEFASDMIELWDANMEQTFFIYGGHWLAHYESPQGMQDNALYGKSTNQHFVNGSRKVNIVVDDHIFLRPNQSEFVFLQFGEIISIRGKEIDQKWPILKA